MNIYWFIKNSLTLDLNFISVSSWTIDKKFLFIILKYVIIFKHFLKPFVLGESWTDFQGKKIFYDSPYGLAGYQSMMARHQMLIKLAGVKNVKTIIDVGANVGFFTLLMRDLYPRAKIYSFEPAPATFSCLEKNVTGDKYTYPVRIGVSDKRGSSFMKFDPNTSAFSTIQPRGNLRVKLTTLDRFISSKKISQIDLLKIDTEKHELCVLKGAGRTLAKTRFLHIEITMENNLNYTFSRILKELSTPNYDFQLLAYRSYTDKSMGKATVFDLLLKNTFLS